MCSNFCALNKLTIKDVLGTIFLVGITRRYTLVEEFFEHTMILIKISLQDFSKSNPICFSKTITISKLQYNVWSL